jgi:hypothetical protein
MMQRRTGSAATADDRLEAMRVFSLLAELGDETRFLGFLLEELHDSKTRTEKEAVLSLIDRTGSEVSEILEMLESHRSFLPPEGDPDLRRRPPARKGRTVN